MPGKSARLTEVVLYLAALPLLLFPGTAATLGLFFLVAQIVIRRRRTGYWFPPGPFNLPIALLLFTALLGVWVSPDRQWSINRFWGLLLGMATFYTILSPMRRDRTSPPVHFLRIVMILVLVGVGLALISLVVTDWSAGALLAPYGLAQRLPMLIHLPGSGVPNPAEGANPRLVGGTMALIIPLALAMALLGEGKAIRWLGGLAVIPLALPIVLSQSPQAYLALVLAIGWLVACQTLPIAYPRRQPWLWAAGALLAIAFILTWHNWSKLISPELSARLLFAVQMRLEIWRRAVLIIRDYSFTGAGLNSFPALVGNYGLPHPVLMPHAHNVFLQTAADQGALGLVCLIVIFGIAFRAGWRAWRTAGNGDMRAVLAGCAAGCVAYLGYGLFDSMSLGNKPAFLVWALLGLLVAANPLPQSIRSPTVERRTAAQNLWRKRLRRAAILALGASALLSIPLWASALLVNLARISSPPLPPAHIPSELPTAELLFQYTRLASRLYPANSRAQVLAGLVSYSVGDDPSAIAAWERALATDGFDPLTQLQLADAYARQDQEQAALLHWAAAGAADLLLERGKAALKLGDLTLAQRWFERVIQLEPANAPAQQHLAQIFVSQKNWPAAIRAYQTLFRINQQNGAAPEILAQNLARLGVALSQAGRLEAARQAFQQALIYDPANALAQKGLANLPNGQ